MSKSYAEVASGWQGSGVKKIKGFKVFNPDWTCRGYQFALGKTFEEEVKPSVCDKGFHFCKQAKDCFNYYPFDSSNKVAEVIALGDVSEEGEKCSTNKIKIVREVTWEEVLTLVNTGKTCTGLGNSGDCNSGNRNSGNFNSGYGNSGNWNSGNSNSGDCNSGNRNSGDCNSGNRNSGDCNRGNRNSGNRNSGDCNRGDWNKTSNAVGCFNTDLQKIKFFDKETDMTLEQWWSSDARHLMNQVDFRPTDWICSNDMSDEEKAEHPEHVNTGGFLKVRDNTDCFKKWWNGLDPEERQIIMNIPNFDANKFLEITGVEVG